MPSLAYYMSQYEHEHSSSWNKLLHGIGIPVIFVGLIFLILTKWIWGAAFFIGGWAFLFLGHKIEGNHPAFFQGPVYFLVGPIWVGKELWTLVTGSRHSQGTERTKPTRP